MNKKLLNKYNIQIDTIVILCIILKYSKIAIIQPFSRLLYYPKKDAQFFGFTFPKQCVKNNLYLTRE